MFSMGQYQVGLQDAKIGNSCFFSGSFFLFFNAKKDIFFWFALFLF